RRNIAINNFVIAKSHDLEHTSDARRWLPTEPSRENRQFSNRGATVHKTSHPDVDRPFVSHPDRRNHDSNQARAEGRPESRGDDRGNARVQPNSDNGRRGSDSGRNEQERGRQPENNRGRGNVSPASQDAQVQPNTDGGRRGNDSRRTETVTFPR